MEAREVLYTTRSMRRLRPDPVPEEVVARIVDAGLRAPCPGEEQPWRFVVVTERPTMARLGTLWRRTRDALLVDMPNLYPNEAQASSSRYLHDHFDDVPVAIFGYGPEGGGAATVVPALWSMCLAARAEGVGATFTQLLSRVQPEVDEILGLPADAAVRLFGVLPMGYPLGRWGVARRRPASEVAFAERWGSAPAWGPVVPPGVGGDRPAGATA